jgi:HK97 family phage portal protein
MSDPWYSRLFHTNQYGSMARISQPSGIPIVEYTAAQNDLLFVDGTGQSYSTLYRTQYAVRTCVNFLALNIAPLNLKTYLKTSDGERLEVPGHPLAQLLQRPNPRTTRYEMIRGTVSDLAIYDNAYWLKVFEGNQRELYRIPPSYVTPRGGSLLTGPRLYQINAGGGPRDFKPDRIVHFKGYDPSDPRQGVSPLEALRSIMNEEISASRHRTGFWKNAARHDGIIERPLEAPDWSTAAEQRFRVQWAQKQAGHGNAGKAAILADGMKWVPDSFSPREAEFMAGREFALDTVATQYQIPLAMLSRKGAATFASMKEFRKVMYVDTLGPWNAMMEGTIWLQLVPDFDTSGDLYTEFNIDEKLQGDFEAQAEALRQSVQVPWMTVNEARALRGFPRIDNSDFDEPAVPVNYLLGDDEPQDEASVTRLREVALAEDAAIAGGAL